MSWRCAAAQPALTLALTLVLTLWHAAHVRLRRAASAAACCTATLSQTLGLGPQTSARCQASGRAATLCQAQRPALRPRCCSLARPMTCCPATPARPLGFATGASGRGPAPGPTLIQGATQRPPLQLLCHCVAGTEMRCCAQRYQTWGMGPAVSQRCPALKPTLTLPPAPGTPQRLRHCASAGSMLSCLAKVFRALEPAASWRWPVPDPALDLWPATCHARRLCCRRLASTLKLPCPRPPYISWAPSLSPQGLTGCQRLSLLWPRTKTPAVTCW